MTGGRGKEDIIKTGEKVTDRNYSVKVERWMEGGEEREVEKHRERKEEREKKTETKTKSIKNIRMSGS